MEGKGGKGEGTLHGRDPVIVTIMIRIKITQWNSPPEWIYGIIEACIVLCDLVTGDWWLTDSHTCRAFGAG